MPAIDHVRQLAGTIGPRGSTTDAERRASEYCAEHLRTIGLAPSVEPFTSAISNWRPYALFSALMLLAMAIFLVDGSIGAVLALALGGVTLTSALLELSFQPNPLRWILPKGSSQNVWAQVSPAGKVRQQVVLIGHLDTHRTPLVFSSDAWLRFFGTLVPLGLLSSAMLILLFIVGIFSGDALWRILSLLPGLLIIGLLLITVQADLTPYTAGANDNASGAAVVLSLAERAQREPLSNTAVWAVLTGCEEVGCYGAAAFARQHRHDLPEAYWLTIDTVGGPETAIHYLTKETFLLTTHSDPALLGLADGVAEQHPELPACRGAFAGAFTESAIGGKFGFRVLTFIARQEDGSVPEWHRPTDVFERLDAGAAARCEAFLWSLLQALDGVTNGEG